MFKTVYIGILHLQSCGTARSSISYPEAQVKNFAKCSEYVVSLTAFPDVEVQLC